MPIASLPPFIAMFLLCIPLAEHAPAAPEEGAEQVTELVQRSLQSGGLRPAATADGKGTRPSRVFKQGQVEIGDSVKLSATLLESRELMTEPFFHALVGIAEIGGPEEVPVFVHMLRTIGELTGDAKYLRMAAHFDAKYELPKPTPAGVHDLQELVRVCVESGGLRLTQDSNGGRTGLVIEDAEKLRAALVRDPALVTPAAFDTAIATAEKLDHAALLRAIGEALGDKRAQAWASYLFGRRHKKDQEWAVAVRELEDAAARFDSLGDEPRKAAALAELGKVHQTLGEHDAARDRYHEALGILRRTYGEQHLAVGRMLYNLGSVYTDREEYQKALQSYVQASEILGRSKETDPADMAAIVHNIALVFSRIGDDAQALDNFRFALSAFQQIEGPEGPSVATCLKNMGYVYQRLGDYDRAREHFDRALAIRLSRPGRYDADVAHSLLDMATICAVRGEHGLALYCQQQALAIFSRLYGPQHPDVVRGYHQIGHLYLQNGNRERALEYFDRALASLGLSTESSVRVAELGAADYRVSHDLVRILEHRGQVLAQLAGADADSERQTDHLRAAYRTYAVAADALDRLRDRIVGEDDRVRTSAGVFGIFPEWIGVCRQLFAVERDAAFLDTAYEAAERGAARVFLESLGDPVARTLGGVSPQLQAEERDILAAIRRLDKEALAAGSRTPSAGDPTLPAQIFTDERKGLETRLNRVTERMKHEHPQYAALRSPRPCSLGQARECLAESEVVLYYVLGADASYLILLEGAEHGDAATGGISIHPLPPAEQIREQVEALTEPTALELPARVRALGAEAYAMLLAPVAQQIRGKDLVIVPSGALCYLPFELFIEPGPGAAAGEPVRYLIEGHRIRYAPSLSALYLARQWQRARPQPTRSVWVVADPVYATSDPRAARSDAVDARPPRGEKSTAAFPRLRYSAREADDVLGLMGGSPEDARTGLQASEASVKKASAAGRLAEYRYVHFATHGILGGDPRRQPSLVLSLVGNDGEDGFLELDEIALLRLNADLVVLSACSSGQGELYDGEGVRGIARAFLYAGSRGVLSSLWQVEDQRTARLMTRVYRELRTGHRTADALRDAQLEMIAEAEPPLYWAPFILIGE